MAIGLCLLTPSTLFFLSFKRGNKITLENVDGVKQ